jgi:hypothetical protein
MENFLSLPKSSYYIRNRIGEKIKTTILLGFLVLLLFGGDLTPSSVINIKESLAASLAVAFQVQIGPALFNLVAPARAPCGFQITLRPYFYFFLSMF